MVQGLTDVLCTAGKLSAVLSLFPFHFPSPISHFSLTLFSSHCPALCSLFISSFILIHFSLSVCSPLIAFLSPSSSPYPLPKFLISIFPVSLFQSHFTTVPSSLSHFSLSHCSLFSLYPLPFYSLPFSVSVCSYLLPYLPLPSTNFPFPFVPSLLYSLPVFTGPFFPFSLLPSHSASHCSRCIGPSPYFLGFLSF